MQLSKMELMIKEHIDKYPLMEVRDVCKLIYQSIFGGGHMIPESSYSLNRLQEEYESIKDVLSEKSEVTEQIGGGICRIYLDSLKQGLAVDTLNSMFVLSANRKKGTVEELEDTLEKFLVACKDLRLPFHYEQAVSFIRNWKQNGYPAISHSDTYRKHYQPAYRVADEVYSRYYHVFLEIDRLLAKNEDKDRPIIIVIDGMAGSGKSTLGDLLKEIYDCNLFHVDDYFLQPHQRTEERLVEPGGNVDYERFKKEIYDQLESGKDFVYQKYDCSVQALGEKVEVKYKKLNIIEGAYSAHPYFENRADLVFFMEIPDELQIERIGARNGEWMLKRFIKEWIPMEHLYFETYRIREKGIIISGE